MMKTKVFTLIFLTAILSLAIVSAGLTITPNTNNPTSVNHDDGSFTVTFDVENTDASSVSVNLEGFVNNGATITLSDESFTLLGNAEKTITATITFDENLDSNFLINLNAKIGSVVSDTGTITVSINEDASLSVSSPAISIDDTEVTVTVENTGNTDFALVNVEVEDISGLTFGDITPNDFSLNAGDSRTVTIDVDVNPGSLDVGTNDATVTVSADDETATSEITLETEYCVAGNRGVLKIDRLDFTNNGMGDDDEWYLTDEIEVEVRIENTDDDNDVDDIVVEWGLYNKETGEFIIDDEEDEFNLDDDEDETLTFSFTLDPEDFDEDYNENDFAFYIKAYSEDSDHGEDVTCDAEIEEITIIKDDNFVIVDDIELTADNLPCGEELSGEFRVWNVGEEDEDDVYVIITNEELGINEKIMVGDIDVLDDIKRTFSARVPSDASEKTYTLKFEVYDEDDDIFENNEDDEARFTKTFDVEGECREQGAGDVLITAVNDPTTPNANAGKQFIIKTTLTNTGDVSGTYTVAVFGNSAWSTLASIDPQLIVLEAGESKDVSIVLSVDDEAEGDKELTIKATSGDEVNEQKVLVSVSNDGKEGPEFDAFSEHIKNNWFIYVIVLINVILIIAIILVIRSMVRPREVYG
jgi:hypothetical protein